MVFIIRQPEKDLGPVADVYSKTTYHINGLWQVLDAAIPSAAEEALWGRKVQNTSFGLLTGELTYKSGVGVVNSEAEKEHEDENAKEWWMRNSASTRNVGVSPQVSPEKARASQESQPGQPQTESTGIKFEVPSVGDMLDTIQRPFRHANRGPQEQWS
mmetsp:Transcript_36184/g.72981  ORF Transcript_36184/g.72981 Transcript_36184/m.72981 type:complete len:158 (-) Transcript_36184:119-592(-)